MESSKNNIFETKTEYNKKLITKAAWLFWKKYTLSLFLISIVSLIISSTAIFYFNYKNWIAGTYLSLSILLIFICIGTYFVYRNRSMDTFLKMEDPVIRWKIDEKHFSFENDLGKSDCNWKMIKEIIYSDNFWLLIYINGTYSILPTEGVSSEFLDFFKSQLRKHKEK